MDIYDTYKIGMDSETIVKKLGTWRLDYGLQISQPVIWMRRASLEGFHFR